METSKLVATIKLLPVYTCAECGKRQAGTTRTLNFDGYTLEEFEEYITRLKKLEPRSHDMPYGWCFDGKFKCEVCK